MSYLADLLLINHSGELYAWGYNNHDEFGVPTTGVSAFKIPGSWRCAAAGKDFSKSFVIGVKNDGTLWRCGLGPPSSQPETAFVQVGLDNDWVYCAAGTGVAFMVKADGSLWGFGENTSYQLGLGSGDATNKTAPVQIGAANDWGNAKIVSAGYHTLALKSNGSLWGWGFNDSAHGELGQGAINTTLNVPTELYGTGQVIDVATRTHMSAIILDPGLIYAAGDQEMSLVFNHSGSPSFVQVHSTTDWDKIALCQTGNVAIARRNFGTVYTSGQVDHPARGIDPDPGMLDFVQVGSLTNWVAVDAVDDTCYAITDVGLVYGFGSDDREELNQPLTNSVDYGIPVPVLPSQSAKVFQGEPTLAVTYTTLNADGDMEISIEVEAVIGVYHSYGTIKIPVPEITGSISVYPLFSVVLPELEVDGIALTSSPMNGNFFLPAPKVAAQLILGAAASGSSIIPAYLVTGKAAISQQAVGDLVLKALEVNGSAYINASELSGDMIIRVFKVDGFVDIDPPDATLKDEYEDFVVRYKR